MTSEVTAFKGGDTPRPGGGHGVRVSRVGESGDDSGGFGTGNQWRVHLVASGGYFGVEPTDAPAVATALQRHGVQGLLDRRRGTPSKRRAPLEEVERILRLYRDKYSGFNGRHFHEIARREHAVKLSYSFVKKALQAAGLMRKYRPRGRHRMRREPRACFGEMLHLDGSPHAWLGLTASQRQTLVSVLDDATSRLLYAQLFSEESARAVMMALREVLTLHGLPASLYTDRAGWAVFTPKAGGPYDRQRLTYVGVALHRLGIEHILAYSPQARGRSERLNRTLQGRLVNELRIAGIRDLASANAYLKARFIPGFNQRFVRAPRDPHSAFVSLGRVDLDQLLCFEEERVVNRDNTVAFEGRALQLAKQPGRRTCAGLRVQVRRHLDGSHSVWRAGCCLAHFKDIEPNQQLPKGNVLLRKKGGPRLSQGTAELEGEGRSLSFRARATLTAPGGTISLGGKG
ncbi:MAG: ISNCY family transposase [Acidobacteria bacterium]|nr:ISNCY family transposase [Acidobacteriota bacterium]